MSAMRRLVVLVAAALAGGALLTVEARTATPREAEAPAAERLSDDPLLYVSDYFSFVGRDAEGHVAFALDNNRGRDGDAYQAEHFVVLHDERRGWVPVAGTGSYPNTGHELARIPDSASFRFEGWPASGMTIASRHDPLVLRIEPITVRVRREHAGGVYWLGSSAAVLEWEGRAVPGRVIYEYLMRPGWNRLTRTYFGQWRDFQGLYLVSEPADDVYVHSHRGDAGLSGRLLGFTVLDGQADPMTGLEVTVLERAQGLGFYRWPTAWRIAWTGTRGPASLELALSDRRRIATWVLGGFAMGIAHGHLTYDGRTQPVYGLAELIR